MSEAMKEARRLLRADETLMVWTNGGREDSTVPDMTTWTVAAGEEIVHPDCTDCEGHTERGNVMAGLGRDPAEAIDDALAKLRERAATEPQPAGGDDGAQP